MRIRSSLSSFIVLTFKPFCETFLIRVSFVFSDSSTNDASSSSALSAATSSDRHHRSKRQVEDKRVVCYFANWSVYRTGTAKFTPQNINPYLCTHLIYAFGGLGKDDTIQPFDKYQDLEKGKNLERAPGSTNTDGAWSN